MQAQRFVRSTVFCWDWRLEGLEGCFIGVLDVAVTLGFAFQAVASKLCVRYKPQSQQWRFLVGGGVLRTCRNVWCGANFAEATKI